MPSVFAHARLENEESVLKVLQDLSDGVVRERVQEAVKAGAEIVDQEARMRAPVGTRPPRRGVDTGRLQRSIKAKGISVKRAKREVGAYVEADYPENARVLAPGKRKGKQGYKEYYAYAPEYGVPRRNMEAHPYLTPALEVKAQEVQDKIVSALDELCTETNRNI